MSVGLMFGYTVLCVLRGKNLTLSFNFQKMPEEYVILVDENDNELGSMEKIEAHEKAVLHRAFSIFIFNNAGQMMLQRRALSKYHSPGLWTNTCCSHPRPGETLEQATQRRIVEEMGFQCEMREIFHFIYKSPFDHGLTEHELDHVFMGLYNEDPVINPEEVEEWKWMDVDELLEDVSENPDDYTVWFKIALAEMEKKGLLI
jgi:isopentenyl-diphosphate delta-isomerase